MANRSFGRVPLVYHHTNCIPCDEYVEMLREPRNQIPFPLNDPDSSNEISELYRTFVYLQRLAEGKMQDPPAAHHSDNGFAGTR